MNSATLSGILAFDPELRYEDGYQGQVVKTTTNLVICDYNGVESMVQVVAWKAKGEELHKICRKGQTVVLTGYLNVLTKESPSGLKNKYAQLAVSSFLIVGEASEATPPFKATTKAPVQLAIPTTSPGDSDLYDTDLYDTDLYDTDLDEIPF